MPNWVVSSHGGKETHKSKFRKLIAPTEKFKYGVTMVAPGLEVVMFEPQGAIFYGGDDELDALIAGRENDKVVTDRIHKIKKGGDIIVDYNAYGTTDFRSGIYIVGSGNGAKAHDLPDGSITKLSKIMRWAAKDRVKRIYWLACSELMP